MSEKAYEALLERMVLAIGQTALARPTTLSGYYFATRDALFLDIARAAATAAGLVPGRRIIAPLGDGQWQDPDGRVYFARDEMIPEASAGNIAPQRSK